MARNPVAVQFRKFLVDLHSERARLEKQLAGIMEVLQGVAVEGMAKLRGKRRGRPPLATKAPGKRGRRRGRRARLGMTAEAFLTKIIGDAGQLSTAQINAEWKKERGGSAGNTLTKMTNKDKKLVKLENPDGRGSIYKLAAAPTA